jgi:phage terminase large subunit
LTVIERRVRIYQQPLHRYMIEGGKRALAVWHRRAGKDEIALTATCELAHKRVASYWHCLPEYEQARKALWTAVNPRTGQRRIDEAFPAEITASRDEHSMFIRLKCGSTWQLIGSDRFGATVGAGPAGIVYSEWARANPSAWAYHKPMLRENRGWALFITTPLGRNHVKRMHDSWSKRADYFTEILTVDDTRMLSAEELEEELADYIDIYGEDAGRAYYEQEYLCSFNAAILGAFYSREMLQVRNEGRICEVEALAGVPVHTAWDIGVRDDTSIWWWQMQGAQPVILDCYTAPGGDVGIFAEIDAKKREEFGWPRIKGDYGSIDWVPHDAKVRDWGTTSGRTRLETMQVLGLNPRLVPDVGKLDGIAAVRRSLPYCVFHPRCDEHHGIEALEQYRREWDDDRKMFRESEYRDWTTHLSDAFRYFALAWREIPKREKPKLPTPGPGQVLLPGPPEPRRATRIRI